MTPGVRWWILGSLLLLGVVVPLVVGGVREINARNAYLAQHCAPTGEVSRTPTPVLMGKMPTVLMITRSEWRCDDGRTHWL